MASTFSPNLALELMATHDKPGSWGDTNNLNLGTLIEQAISGYATQAITDGADTIITIPNGATGVARNMFLELTGALTGARNLIVPANQKLYFIYNNTTGNYEITVKVNGQTGVAVTMGQKILLVCNGTDIVEATNQSPFTLVGKINHNTLTLQLPVPSGGVLPDTSYTHQAVITWTGGESKFAPWRQYFNAMEHGWTLTYNAPIDPYTAYPPTFAGRDVGITGAGVPFMMKINVAEGSSEHNYWGLSWGGPEASAGSVPDWLYGPEMFYYNVGMLRLRASSGRESSITLTSNDTSALKSFTTRATSQGVYKIQITSAWQIANSSGIPPSSGTGIVDALNISQTGLVTIPGTLFLSGDNGFADTEVIRPSFRDYSLTQNNLGNISGDPVTIDYTLGNYVTATTTGTTTWAFTNPPPIGTAGGFILKLTNGGSATQIWPTSVDWPGGIAPTLTVSGIDILTFITDDEGTTWHGVTSMIDSK